jgi:hypothetical protein
MKLEGHYFSQIILEVHVQYSFSSPYSTYQNMALCTFEVLCYSCQCVIELFCNSYGFSATIKSFRLIFQVLKLLDVNSRLKSLVL